MVKKNSMQKKVKESEMLQNEQMDLIDVSPKNSKEIIRQAKIYKIAQTARTKALAKEVAAKKILLELIGEEHLQRLEDGKIKFKLDGYTITVTPRDELVRIKEDSEEE